MYHGEPCYGWPYCTVQRALVYVMQVNVYEKAVSRVSSSSFRRRPYLCFYDGPRTRSFFSRRETFELRGTITSSIYTSVIPWNNSNFKSFTCFNYSCYGCGSINSVPVGFWGAREIVGILWKMLLSDPWEALPKEGVFLRAKSIRRCSGSGSEVWACTHYIETNLRYNIIPVFAQHEAPRVSRKFHGAGSRPGNWCSQQRNDPQIELRNQSVVGPKENEGWARG